MATKCRKWVSFTAFFLGVSLLVAAACCAYGLSYRFSPVDVADAFASNYQTTQRFRSLMEERLDIFMNGARDHPHQADYDEAYRDEDSLLYLVVKGDTLLWTNAADFDLPADLGKLPGYLPIGYNFSLYFDGKSISMNGAPEATDLDKWFLPGQDTEVPVSAASTQVWLCASEAPGWVFQNYVTSQLTICRGYLKSAWSP